MILRRLGNKSKIAKQLQAFFPSHSLYLEPFFGAGGMFFNKPKVQYNIMNDSDSEIFNLYMTLRNQREAFTQALEEMPISEDLFDHWKKTKETDPVLQAVRFVMLSNFGVMGCANSMRFERHNNKTIALSHIDFTYNYLSDVQFMNSDFRQFFKKINASTLNEDAFAYCDPPYLSTSNNYASSFSEQDSLDLFDTLMSVNIKWAMSEFEHPFILEQAKQRNLNVINVAERRNIQNRRNEILITNYTLNTTLFN